jgi:hypothetical protein
VPLDGIRSRTQYEALDEIETIIRLLSSEDRWCKNALRSDEGRVCILGAILAVHRGRASLTEPILLAIHHVTGQRYRRIEAFNDDPATTHALVVEVLYQARERLLALRPPTMSG